MLGGLLPIVVLGGGGQSMSMGIWALLRGTGVTRPKSAELLLVSSATSRAVGQLAAIERRIAIPVGIAAAGVPAPGAGSVPLKLPQATQSGGCPSTQQTAPPAPLMALRSASMKSGSTPNIASTPVSP